MSKYENRAIMSLLNMCNEMFRKNIEIRRITKTCTLLLLSGLSPYDIPKKIVDKCIASQKDDGGFIGNTDTIWNIKFLEFYPQFEVEKQRAINWLISNNGAESGFGRSKRDMHRIPVTGLALYLLPEIATEENLEWLESTWCSELNSLTYKAAYTILAFNKNKYKPKINENLIKETADWLSKQQEISGGFAPWLKHPVGENVYCTAVALIALISMKDDYYRETIKRAYDYLCLTQLKSGIWAYHEIEDGASWGLYALTQAEKFLEE
ncbi:MAG: terpene cyclase/mutase family protein [Phascolarctobacterium sp.]|nr:terpene cyclase/mutase family protein [Phascolarctobacterium sp.]